MLFKTLSRFVWPQGVPLEHQLGVLGTLGHIAPDTSLLMGHVIHHPPQIPSHWKSEGVLIASILQNACGRGWRLVQFDGPPNVSMLRTPGIQDAAAFFSNRIYLLPPESILSNLMEIGRAHV